MSMANSDESSNHVMPPSDGNEEIINAAKQSDKDLQEVWRNVREDGTNFARTPDYLGHYDKGHLIIEYLGHLEYLGRHDKGHFIIEYLGHLEYLGHYDKGHFIIEYLGHLEYLGHHDKGHFRISNVILLLAQNIPWKKGFFLIYF